MKPIIKQFPKFTIQIKEKYAIIDRKKGDNL